MKKLILLLFTIMSMGLSANAQMCQTTGNVEPSISTGGNYINVSLQNYNNYMVTVDVTITVVSTDGSEKQYTRTVVLKGNESKSVGDFYTEGRKDVSINDSSVSLQVMRCD